MPLIQLIFQSTLVDKGSANLSDIFHTVRIRNKNKGITGLILCSGDRFFEVLEGENAVKRNRDMPPLGQMPVNVLYDAHGTPIGTEWSDYTYDRTNGSYSVRQ